MRVFLVLLSPPGHERVHVKLLARICRLARDADFISRLSEAGDALAIVEAIETIDAQHP